MSEKNSNDDVQLMSAYDAVCMAEEKLDHIESDIEKTIPSKIDLCEVQGILLILDKISESLVSTQNTLTSTVTDILSSGAQSVKQNVADKANDVKGNIEKKAKEKTSKKKDKAESNNDKQIEESSDENTKNTELSIDKKYIKYYATQIILKKYQIIKYRVEYIKTGIQIISAQFTKMVLSGMMLGKGSASNPTNEVMVESLTAAGKTAQTIMNTLNAIIAVVNGAQFMNVNGAGMAFFATPKSITKTNIAIANTNKSTTNNIPAAISTLITQSENQIRTANGKLKTTKVIQMGVQGAQSATNGSFNPGSFDDLPKFDTSVIRNSIEAIMQTLVDADALPRYEKLKITNIRFLNFLLTGFEPAGKRSFGLPAYP